MLTTVQTDFNWFTKTNDKLLESALHSKNISLWS